jgi:hypothetical protein
MLIDQQLEPLIVETNKPIREARGWWGDILHITNAYDNYEINTKTRIDE